MPDILIAIDSDRFQHPMRVRRGSGRHGLSDKDLMVVSSNDVKRLGVGTGHSARPQTRECYVNEVGSLV